MIVADLESAVFGRFQPGRSFMHKLDPRTKLLAVIGLVVAVFGSQTYAGIALSALLVLAACAASRISPKTIAKATAPLMIIAAIAVILNVFFTQGGEVYVSWGFIAISERGVNAALLAACRLTVLLTGATLLTLTTAILDITEAFERLLSPLRSDAAHAHHGDPRHNRGVRTAAVPPLQDRPARPRARHDDGHRPALPPTVRERGAHHPSRANLTRGVVWVGRALGRQARRASSIARKSHAGRRLGRARSRAASEPSARCSSPFSPARFVMQRPSPWPWTHAATTAVRDARGSSRSRSEGAMPRQPPCWHASSPARSRSTSRSVKPNMTRRPRGRPAPYLRPKELAAAA